MSDTLDKLMDTAGRVADAAAKGAVDLVNKGRDKAEEVALQNKLGKLHKQLGSLVYALRKNDEENEPMIAWYISEIDRVNAKLLALQGGSATGKKDPVTWEGPEDGAGDDADATFCGGDGD